MDNHTDHPLTLTVEQAAKLLGIGRSTAYELVHTGDIPSLRLGRRIVVPVCQVEAMLGGPADTVRKDASIGHGSREAPYSTTWSSAPMTTEDQTADRTPTLF